MKRALIKNNVILLISAFMMFFIVVFFTLYDFDKRNQQAIMENVINEVELEYNLYQGDATAFVDLYLVSSGRRITILDSNGLVLADSHDDTVGQDKSERPEIKELGRVFIRRSETIGVNLLYIARQMEDGNYLRIALPKDDHTEDYNRVIFILIFTSLGFITIYYYGLIKVNEHLLRPWEQVKKGLVALNEREFSLMSLNSPYPEINDILHDINDITYETQKHLQEIESYQLQLSEILNGLKQGVMLFNESEQLVYYNEDAKVYFELTEDTFMKPSYYAIRYNEIKEAISQANNLKQPSSFDLKMDGKTIDVKVFHIHAKGYEQTNATVLCLFKDVTQERAMEQIKRDFFSHASHELKSPLTAIRGYAELIENEMIDPKSVKSTAKEIVKQTELMTLLVEDMLMLSRLENLKEKTYQKENITNVLSEVKQALLPLAKQKSIKLDIKSESLEMMCDLIDIQKLFKNVIENAIKYSDPEKTVLITLKKQDDYVLFQVKDQGYGISPEHQQRVFERFYRVDKGRLDGGTGLGLAIVKHIVLKYDGKIDLKSSLSKGTNITITLKP